MKKENRNRENRIVKAVAIGCVSLVACVCVGAGVYLQNLQKANAERQKAKENTEVMVQETGAVQGEQTQARNFLNQPAVSIPGDKREVIHIVEIIPHEACSIFPYLVEWGTKEEYDKYTPLGYEGIQFMATSSGLTQFGPQGIYNYIEGGAIAETLKDYSAPFTTWYGKQGSPYWWREADPKKTVMANGYFEYVGPGKGLYNINLSSPFVKGNNTDVNNIGIHYDVMAMERKGSENKKGEWEVKDAQYFWAKDYESENYPTDTIRLKTGYNYDLKFETGNQPSGVNEEYRVKNVNVQQLSRNAVSTGGFEYQAVWDVTAANKEWDGGYAFSPKGNYKVISVTPVLATSIPEADLAGTYTRISNAQESDGTADVEAGYFRPYSQDDAVETVYKLTFGHVGAGQGNYILNPAAVQEDIAADNHSGTIYETILFEYAGEGKGNCDVVFIYGPSGNGHPGARYNRTILKVSDENGRYALTSTVTHEDELYESVGNGNGDYSKAVTRIDCLGADYNKTDEGWYGTAGEPLGLCIGRKYQNAGLTDEMGAWVFHTVDSDEVNDITKIEELENGKRPNRIYVYNQKRKNCYYTRNTFKNNEWFKLLIYLSDATDTKGLAADAYASGRTGQEIVEMYRDKIQEFDKSYRIEIIQRTPSALTVDEVNDADLIYMSETVGIYGLASQANYDKVNDYIGGGLPPFPADYEMTGKFKFTDDFSDEVLMALYENCLYHEEGKTPTTAFMPDMPALTNPDHMDGMRTKDNFGKLNYMTDLFDDQADFADFIQGYEENTEHWNNEDGYSTILPGSGNAIALYPHPHVNGVTTYNLGTKKLNTEEEVQQTTDNQWQYEYFQVYQVITGSDGMKDLNWTAGAVNGASDSFMAQGETIYNKEVQPGWTYWAPDPVGHMYQQPGEMLNIWKIMHNRTSKKRSTPKVIVTNSDYMNVPTEEKVATDYYIYVDEYEALSSDAFQIDYKVNWTPEEITEPTPLSSLKVTRAADNSVVATVASPGYETEYHCNVAGDFAGTEGQLNGAKAVQYLITAVDEKNKADTAVVWVIVRDSFMLN